MTPAPIGNLTYQWSTGATTPDITVFPTQTTTYVVTVSTGAECESTDSKTIDVNPSYSVHISDHACDSYSWNGNTYNTNGEYTQLFQSQSGCDSLVTLHLTIHHSDTVNYNITSCESYFWHGQTYSASGNYFHDTVNDDGCNRLELLHLTISDGYREEYHEEECDSYQWSINQQWYFQTAIDSVVVEGQQGTCDSTFVLNLLIHHGDTLDLDPVEACDMYEWHGMTYTQSGQLTFLTTNEFGCSRLELLSLTINHSDTITSNITSCGEYVWHGQSYNANGQYTHETTNEDGCYRLELLNLTISDSYREEYHEEECEGYLWPVNQQWYYQSVLDSIVVEGQQGICDSTFVLDLTIHYGDTLELEPVVSCESYSWHGQTYSASGQYFFSTTNEYGCDRLELLDLTISDSYRHVDEVEECEGYLWPVNQQWYYQSILDSIVVEGQQGTCDSIFVLDLKLSENLSASIVGRTTIYPSTDIISGVYPYYVDSTSINPTAVHWSIDRDDWYVLPHGASCELVCTSAGWGELRAWTEGESCNLDTTLFINAQFFGLDEESEESIKIYPNPTQGTITIDGDNLREVKVHNVFGQEIFRNVCNNNSHVINMERCCPGLYFIEIVTPSRRLYKLVVLTN